MGRCSTPYATNQEAQEEEMIDKFISAFKNGQASASRYQVQFTLPRGIPQFTGARADSTSGRIQGIQSRLNGNGIIDMLCHTATMPQRSLLTYEHRQENAPYKVPYSQSYDPASFMFYADSDMSPRRYFEIWQQAVVNVKNNTLNFYDEYTSDVTIWQLSREGKKTYGIKLYEAFPTAVSAVDYSYSNADSITNIAVVLSYKYWMPESP